jgi:5-methylcytosine-specific restriction endonuclease McrA
MPPSAVKTIRDLIFWQYAKIISESAGYRKDNYRFIMSRFKKLQSGEIEWSSSIREYIRERESPTECIYCGAKTDLCYDHLIPRTRGGPDTPDNVVMACRGCNSSKANKGVYEWFELDWRDAVPRIAEGKYLKLLYPLHDERGTLNISRAELESLCAVCEVGYLCDETELTVYCLESVLGKA